MVREHLRWHQSLAVLHVLVIGLNIVHRLTAGVDDGDTSDSFAVLFLPLGLELLEFDVEGEGL